MTPTQELASFIAKTEFGALPDEALEKSKWLIIDGIAVTLGGYRHIGEKILAFVRALGGEPTSTIMGSGHRINAPLAAYANGAMSHFLDYDDLNQTMGGHPTGPVLSAVLAAGELVGATGKQMLLAYILGVETETKIGRAILHNLYGSGWHPTSVLGNFGAAAATSKLLGLNAKQTLMALGIAGSTASGIKQNFGTMIKPLHIGQAAKNGVMAALLAKEGWIADEHILEGNFGICNLFCGKGTYDLKEMTRFLGNPWEIIHPGVELKKYPCCGSIHSSIDALFTLVAQTPLTADEIKTVTCSVHPDKTHILVHPRPRTGLEGKFSLEYCLAAALLHKKITLTTFDDERVKEKAITEFLPCISTIKDAHLPLWGSRVTIETLDGKTITKGHQTFPGITLWKDLENKFLDCSVPVLGSDQARLALTMLKNFETLPNTADLMNSIIQPGL